MKKFRDNIREKILLKTGTIFYDYDKAVTLNRLGVDPIDEIIITAAEVLENRVLRVFGLLYKCHSMKEVSDRLQERGYNILKMSTIERYMQDATRQVIAEVSKEEYLTLIKKEIGETCGNAFV